MKRRIVWALFSLFLVSTQAFSSPQVRVEGLFKGAAVLNINGEQVMLKNGKSHPSGVKLVKATSRQAIVEMDGKQHTMGLHMAIGGTYQKADITQVVIKKNDINQYKVNGSVNGLTVTFLVDTGATTVAMNELEARRLGIQYKLQGKESRVSTASGVAKSWYVKLDTVKVGEIAVNNVGAVVIEGSHPTDVLLGMTYLEYVKLQEHNSILMLEKKF